MIVTSYNWLNMYKLYVFNMAAIVVGIVSRHGLRLALNETETKLTRVKNSSQQLAIFQPLAILPFPKLFRIF